MSELSFAPTRLEQDGLWLTSALLPILRERGAMTQINEKPKSRILESQGILVPTCMSSTIRILVLITSQVQSVTEEFKEGLIYSITNRVSLAHIWKAS